MPAGVQTSVRKTRGREGERERERGLSGWSFSKSRGGRVVDINPPVAKIRRAARSNWSRWASRIAN